MATATRATGVTIRHAQQDDADRLVDWITKVAKESENKTLDPRVVASGVAAALADPRHRRYYIAEHEGEQVGCCLVTTEWSDWTGTWYWWLQSIYVEPEHRGPVPGVLRVLVAGIEKEAKADGVRSVSLYVHEKNQRAIRAYEKCGCQKGAYLIFQKTP